MPRIYDWAVQDVERTVTVGDLRALKGTRRQVAQVTADTADEGAAAEAAGIEMVLTRARNVPAVRRGSGRVFVTAALGFTEAITDGDILRTAISALTDGADAVITGRSLHVVERLAREGIPVMGHLGMVPRQSSWMGGIRACGKTADEAMDLFRRFGRLESAGAFAVEAELVVAPVMEQINRRTGLVTVSLGSGPHADALFLFTSDVCGEQAWRPRHARAYGNLARLYEQIQVERKAALRAFRDDIATGGFPAASETTALEGPEYEAFVDWLQSDESKL